MICDACRVIFQDPFDATKHTNQLCENLSLTRITRSKEQESEAKRDPAGVRYDILDPIFEELMAKIAHYGAEHYGDLNWHKSRLQGDKSPMNHIRKHITAYLKDESYDHPEVGAGKEIHLAAIAFNAMMEFWYATHLDLNLNKVSYPQLHYTK